MNVEWLLSWWNIIFILPFGLAMLYLALYTVSGVTFGDGEADLHADVDGADADLDGGGDLHADADLQHDVHFGADADADADAHDAADSDADGGGQSIHMAILGWLGVGRVPLSIVLMVLLLFWGSIGFITNVLLRPQVGESWHAALGSLPAAALGTLLLTRGVVMAMARWLPLNETSARRRHALLGRVGEAIYDIDDKFGLAGVREESGDFYQVPCRIADDVAPIPKGTRVKLVAYGGADGVFYVVPYDDQTIASAISVTTCAAATAATSGVATAGDQSNRRTDRK